MNSIYVWGVPDEVKEKVYVDLTKEIIEVFDYRGLEPVVVYFPPERMKWDLGKEIMVYISGPNLPKECEERDFLAISVGVKVRNAFALAHFSLEHIDCVVLDEPKVGEGRWSWSRS